MALLISDIKLLVNTREEDHLLRGAELARLPCIENAYLIVEGDQIAAYGAMSALSYKPQDFSSYKSATGRMLLPSWCDSHTHLVFSGSREEEFVDKIRGRSYAEIAARGGGILNSAHVLHQTPEEDLFCQSFKRLEQIIRMGTGAVEIKSGYGLNVEDELKMLRVIRRLKEKAGIPVKSSFLGAHSIPLEFKENKEGYIRLVIEQMLPRIAEEKLADYIDVFCEQGFFSPEETRRICLAGKKFGLKPKIHANQLSASGGVQTAVEVGAVSADHLESMDEDAIQSLSGSGTIGTLLPCAAFFLRMAYPPARTLVDAGCALALASDYNPGSSPSGNMNFVLSLACIQMKMLPEEAINAATINGAWAMELEKEVGSITVGKKANLLLTEPVPSLAYLPYSFGSNLIEAVMVKGEWI